MNERQANLLKDIIIEFYQTAQPVGSGLLVKKYYSDLSSATIRNEMAALEKDGYIIQPHTSAGRIPTEAGYQYYLDNFLKDGKLAKNKQQLIDKAWGAKGDSRDKIKNTAKTIAAISKEAVFVAFDRHDYYYTGISNLLAQPEFYQQDLILNISKVIDHFDEVLENIFSQVNERVDIFIGSQNPFSNSCAIVIVKYKIGGVEQLLGILGPMRMDYDGNKAILEYFRGKIIN
jgi:heat-inducible transcriptional repressor